MCGIFGFTTTEKSKVTKSDHIKIVSDLFELSESRGKEASGFITKTKDSISYYKTPRAASEMIKGKEYFDHFNKMIFPASVIGHSRLVTNGSQVKHDNNQPINIDNVIGVHNGIVTNVEEIWDSYKSFNRQFEIDTEVIFKLLNYYISKSNSLEGAVSSTFSEIAGTASIAVFFNNLNKLLIGTNNGSLYAAHNVKKNIFLFTSEMYTTKKIVNRIVSREICESLDIYKIDPGYAMTIDLSTFEINQFSYLQKRKYDKMTFIESSPVIDITPSNKRDLKDSGSGYFNSKLVNVSGLKYFSKNFDKVFEKIKNIKRCKICILPKSFPYIQFNDQGVCNYCRFNKPNLLENNNNKERFISIINKYKNQDNLPDCIVPFSGGRDSSYGLYYLKKELGLNPITYTYDWGMVTDLARRNIARMCGALGVENIIVSADIRKKRNNIKKNVLAWLKNPKLGIVPLFMAGDKQFFYFVNKIKKQTGIKLNIWMPNSLEETSFKYGFCNVRPNFSKNRIDYLSTFDKITLLAYYGKNFFFNPRYINKGISDTIWAYHSYYFEKREDYYSLFDFIEWDESNIESTLINKFDWETSPETRSTWRIGDGTSPFYNYIYFIVAGFSENDTFRSNQIRRGLISRDDAIKRVMDENRPRWNEIKWYCDTIGIDFEDTINRINEIPKLYQT